MIFKLTAKGFKTTVKTYDLIQKELEKIGHRLTRFNPELPQMNLLIRKHQSKYLAKRHHRTYTNFTDRKPSLALYDGSVDLRLPVKKLYVQFKGKSVKECLHIGMNRLEKELDKYKQSLRFSREKLKDLHFKSRSGYPNDRSVGRGLHE